MSWPRVLVCAGGGGVGKTSTSAAIALAAARRGERVLVVTIDPARRLADALGVTLGPNVQAVETSGGGPSATWAGELLALMPDPRHSMRTFVQYLFAGRPKALDRVLGNRMYQVMEDAVPGVHELAALSLVTREMHERGVDLVVIDTAPSRNAVDFITYPKRLADLLGGRAMRWLAQLAHRNFEGGEGDGDMKPRGRVMKLLEKGLGPAIHDVGALSAELVGVMDRFIALNEDSSELLLGGRTRYVLVAAPTRAAEDDALFLNERLKKLSVRPAAVILNGTAEPTPAWDERLRASAVTTEPMRQALTILADERAQRDKATRATIAALAKIDRKLPPIAIPFLGPAPPREIVEGLAAALTPELEAILGR
ncbi:MAG TPA: ArsA family ATPase [Polyangiaceae bacterium]|nr:ArsA family ATPase [Polyangiaceae bacterium]